MWLIWKESLPRRLVCFLWVEEVKGHVTLRCWGNIWNLFHCRIVHEMNIILIVPNCFWIIWWSKVFLVKNLWFPLIFFDKSWQSSFVNCPRIWEYKWMWLIISSKFSYKSNQMVSSLLLLPVERSNWEELSAARPLKRAFDD